MPLEDTTITQSTHTSDPAYQVHLCTVCHGIGKGHSCSTAHMPDISTRRQNNSHTPISSNHKIPSSHTHHTPSSTTYFKTHKRFSSQYKNHTHPKKTVTKHSILFWNSTYKKHATHTISDTH